MRNPVATAAQMTCETDRLSDKTFLRRSRAIDKKVAALQAKRKTLLPLEGAAVAAIDDELLSLAEQRDALNKRQRQLPYPVLSMEPLTWRNRQGYPRLVLFSPLKPNWQCVVGKQNGQSAFQTVPEYDTPIRDLYDDVAKRLLKQIDDGTRTTLTANWDGVIPEDIKAKIRELQMSVGHQRVFLLAEPSSYHLSFEEIPKPVKAPNRDPLLVAWHDGVLYLVDKFDLTPVEHYVASEFVAS